MSRWQAWTFHILTIAVSASGMAYCWMKYLLKNDDPFSIVNHPWQPAMLKAHILASPLLILVLGMMVNSHILKKLKNGDSRANRVSGIVCLLSFTLMAGSGYLLQVVSLSGLYRSLVITHLATGAIFAVTYLIHQVVSLLQGKTKLKQLTKSRLAA